MPELVRSITARLREFVRDRRKARRYIVRLPCYVALARTNAAANGGQPTAGIEGFTRDISSDGLALLLPGIRIGDHYLVGENHSLRVRLELPNQTIELLAVAVRYDSWADRSQGCYIVGAHITKLGQEEREHYVAFLTQLGTK